MLLINDGTSEVKTLMESLRNYCDKRLILIKTKIMVLS